MHQYVHIQGVFLLFVHMCTTVLNVKLIFIYILRYVPASFGHHQMYTLLLKLFRCGRSMSRVKAGFLNFLFKKIHNFFKIHKIADSTATHQLATRRNFVS